jgi:hypothetical protein
VTRSAKKTLLEAAFVTRIGEDVLTEMLAHVLVTDDDVTAGVAEAVGLDGQKWRAERVSTQESTPEGRVDLTMSLVNVDERHPVWIEVKAGAREQPDQLERYARELRRRSSDGMLVALAEAGDPILQSAREHELATPLSWQQVLDLCTGVAEGRGGPEWRQRARSVDAPARQRTLAEFSWYLEHRRVAVDIEALSEEDVVAARRAERLLVDEGAIHQLLLKASAGLSGFSRGEPYRDAPGRGRQLALERGVILTADSAHDVWPVLQGANAELWFSTAGTEDLEDEVEIEPMFFSGFVFAKPIAPKVDEALRDAPWRAGLPKGVLLGDDGGGVWIVRMLTLSDLARSADSFSDQVEVVRAWCEKSLRVITAAGLPRGWPAPATGGEGGAPG